MPEASKHMQSGAVANYSTLLLDTCLDEALLATATPNLPFHQPSPPESLPGGPNLRGEGFPKTIWERRLIIVRGEGDAGDPEARPA